MDFAVKRVKLKESEKKDKYLDFARELKKLWNRKVTVIPIVIGALRINKGAGGFGNKRTSRDHPNYSIIKISQNAEKSPGDLRRLAVTQNPSERPSANADIKLLQGIIMIIIMKIIMADITE